MIDRLFSNAFILYHLYINSYLLYFLFLIKKRVYGVGKYFVDFNMNHNKILIVYY